MVELPVVDDDELFSQFVADTGGLTPQAFFTRFKSGEIEDTSENMTLLVKAVALGAGGSAADAPVHHETWARAAFTSVPGRG